jgi:hypothetical protein
MLEHTRRIESAELPVVRPWTDDRVPVEQLAERDYRAIRPPNPTLNNG